MTTATNIDFEDGRTSFGEAVSSFMSNYVTFSGRANRTEYLFSIIFVFVVYVLTGVMGGLIAEAVPLAPLLIVIPALALMLPMLTLTTRRLHDLDISGWWQLVSVVPFIGWLLIPVLCAVKGTDGDNRFD